MATNPILYSLESLGRSTRDLFQQDVERRKSDLALNQQANEQRRALETLRMQGELQGKELGLKESELGFNIEKGRAEMTAVQERTKQEGLRTGILQQQADTQTQAQKDAAAHNQAQIEARNREIANNASFHAGQLEIQRANQRAQAAERAENAKLRQAQMDVLTLEKRAADFKGRTAEDQYNDQRKAKEARDVFFNKEVPVSSLLTFMNQGEKIPAADKQWWTMIMADTQQQGSVDLDDKTIRVGTGLELYKVAQEMRAGLSKGDDTLVKAIGPRLYEKSLEVDPSGALGGRLIGSLTEQVRDPDGWQRKVLAQKEMTDVLTIDLYRRANIDPVKATKAQQQEIEARANQRMLQAWGQGVQTGDALRAMLTTPAAGAPVAQAATAPGGGVLQSVLPGPGATPSAQPGQQGGSILNRPVGEIGASARRSLGRPVGELFGTTPAPSQALTPEGLRDVLRQKQTSPEAAENLMMSHFKMTREQARAFLQQQ